MESHTAICVSKMKTPINALPYTKIVALAMVLAAALIFDKSAVGLSADLGRRSVDARGYFDVERGGIPNVMSIAVTANNEFWGVSGNVIAKHNGSSWMLHGATQKDHTWTRIRSTGNSVFGIGKQCGILAIEDEKVSYSEIADECILSDLSIVDKNNIWVAGKRKTRSDSSAVIQVIDGSYIWHSTPDVGEISAIYVSNNTGWAFGSRGIIRMRDGVWSHYESEIIGLVKINAIAASPLGYLWAVGGYSWVWDVGKSDDSTQVILKYDGVDWIVWRNNGPDSGSPDRYRLNDLAIFGDGTGMAVGERYKIYKLKNGNWINEKSYPVIFGLSEQEEFFGVAGNGADDIRIGGGLGMRVHWNGSDFVVEGDGRCRANAGDNMVCPYTDIDLSSDGDGWVVGEGGPPAYRNGASWGDYIASNISGGSQNLYKDIVSVTVRANGDTVFGTIGGPIDDTESSFVVFSGGAWSAVRSGLELKISEITEDGNGILWAIATDMVPMRIGNSNSALLRSADGVDWETVHYFPGDRLVSVFSDGGHNIYVGGNKLYRVNGERRDMILQSSNFIWDIGGAERDALLITEANSVYIFDARIIKINLSPKDNQGGFYSSKMSHDGLIWIASNDGIYVCIDTNECLDIELPIEQRYFTAGYRDVEIYYHDGYKVFFVGDYETVVSIDGRFGDQIRQAKPSPSATGSLGGDNPILFLPWFGKDAQ